MLQRVAKAHGVRGNLLVAIAGCENGSHVADRVNYNYPISTASGLFQFTNSTWRATRRAMGEPDDSLELKHNNLEQARTAAWKIANGGLTAWDASRKCWLPKL